MPFKIYIYLGAFVTYCDPILVSVCLAVCIHPLVLSVCKNVCVYLSAIVRTCTCQSIHVSVCHSSVSMTRVLSLSVFLLCAHARTHFRKYVQTSTNICVSYVRKYGCCPSVRMCVYIHACIYVSTCIYVCVCVCVYIYVCVCVF